MINIRWMTELIPRYPLDVFTPHRKSLGLLWPGLANANNSQARGEKGRNRSSAGHPKLVDRVTSAGASL